MYDCEAPHEGCAVTFSHNAVSLRRNRAPRHAKQWIHIVIWTIVDGTGIVNLVLGNDSKHVVYQYYIRTYIQKSAMTKSVKLKYRKYCIYEQKKRFKNSTHQKMEL